MTTLRKENTPYERNIMYMYLYEKFLYCFLDASEKMKVGLIICET